ncbi:MAG: DUF3465 domain-containing protein [Methylotenera sp.]
MKKLLLALLIVFATVACDRTAHTAPANRSEQTEVRLQAQAAHTNPNASIEAAYENRASNIDVEGQGIVVKLLTDDNNGSRHQKFLVKIASGKTLLFAHNIDLAPRIEDIKIGDEMAFRGEYVFNPKGGVIHWTHHDPRGEHVAGWIKHNGKVYE